MASKETIDLFRKILMIKLGTMLTAMGGDDEIEITIKLPAYFVKTVTECSFCWAKRGRIEETFDSVINSILADGIKFRFQDKFKNPGDIIKFLKTNEKIPNLCISCILNKFMEVINGSDKPNGKTV